MRGDSKKTKNEILDVLTKKVREAGNFSHDIERLKAHITVTCVEEMEQKFDTLTTTIQRAEASMNKNAASSAALCRMVAWLTVIIAFAALVGLVGPGFEIWKRSHEKLFSRANAQTAVAVRKTIEKTTRESTYHIPPIPRSAKTYTQETP